MLLGAQGGGILRFDPDDMLTASAPGRTATARRVAPGARFPIAGRRRPTAKIRSEGRPVRIDADTRASHEAPTLRETGFVVAGRHADPRARQALGRGRRHGPQDRRVPATTPSTTSPSSPS